MCSFSPMYVIWKLVHLQCSSVWICGSQLEFVSELPQRTYSSTACWMSLQKHLGVCLFLLGIGPRKDLMYGRQALARVIAPVIFIFRQDLNKAPRLALNLLFSSGNFLNISVSRHDCSKSFWFGVFKGGLLCFISINSKG